MGLKEFRNNNLGKAEGFLLESFQMKKHSLVAYLLSLIYAENKDEELSMEYALKALQGTPQLNQKYRKSAIEILLWAVVSIKSGLSVSFNPSLSVNDNYKGKDLMALAAIEEEKQKSEQQNEIPEVVYNYISEDDVKSEILLLEASAVYKRKPRTFENLIPMVENEFINPNKKIWPYIEFAYAKAYLYNLENKLIGNHAIIKENKLDPTVVGDGVRLSNQQAEAVIALSNLNISGLIEGLSKSYIPHHGIVFYDHDNKPVAYITFCFDCEALRVFPHIPFEITHRSLSDQEIKALLEILGQYKSIIMQLKLPIFNSPFGYQDYMKKNF